MLSQPTHRWTVVILEDRYGLLGFSDHTFIIYGIGTLRVPLPAPAVAGLISLPVLVIFIWVVASICKRRNQNY